MSRIKEDAMDESRFDTLAKTLATDGSRRQVFGGLLVASLVILGGAQTEEAASKSLKQCKKIDNKKKRQQCIKKAKQANATQTPLPGTETPLPATESPLPPDAAPVGPPTPTQIPATCSDGVKNGSESDVDCGGPDCLRCGTAKSCVGQRDCGSAFCVNNICTACTTSPQCGAGCSCAFGGCISNTPTIATNCTNCAPYSYCAPIDESSVECYPPCG